MKGGLFTTLFSGAKKATIDASSFQEQKLAEIRDANEAQALLKHAIDSKQEAHIIGCLNLLYRLCHDNPANVQQFGDNGTCALVDQLLGNKFEGTLIYKCSLQVIYMLITKEIESKTLSAKQQSKGKYWGGIATFNLAFVGASSSSNFTRFSGSSTIFRMVKVGNVILSDTEAVTWMLKTLLLQSEDTAFVTKFVPCGGCELIGKLLTQFQETDAVIELTAKLIHNLVLSDLDDHDGKNDVQTKLLKHNVCHLLGVDILKRYPTLSPMSISGSLQAIGSLARRNDDIKALFLSIGTVDTIISISELSGREESQFVGNFFWCLANLTFPNEANQTKFIDAGIGSYVLHLLEAFQGDQEVVEEGLRSLRFLMHGHDANIHILANNDMISLLMKLMRRHAESPQTLQWITFALVSAADSDLCLQKLQEELIGPELIASMQRFANNTDYLQWGCMLVSKLARHALILNDFYLHQLDTVLLEAVKSNYKDAETLEEVLHGLNAVLAQRDDMKLRLIEQGLLGEVLGIIGNFESNELLVELCLQIVSNVFELSRAVLLRPSSSTQSTNAYNSLSNITAESLPYSWQDIARDAQQSPHLLRFQLIMQKVFSQVSSIKLLIRVIMKYIQNASIVEYGGVVVTSYLLALGWSEETAFSSSSTIEYTGVIRLRKISSNVIQPLLSSLPTLYLEMLKYHVHNNVLTCELCLLGLLQCCNFETLSTSLCTADCCQLLLQTLDTHYHQEVKVLLLSYHLIVQLCVDNKCRRIFSQPHRAGNVNIVTTTLAHYVHDIDAMRWGCLVLSAVCLSPLDDALHTLGRIHQRQLLLLRNKAVPPQIPSSDINNNTSSSNIGNNSEGGQQDVLANESDTSTAIDTTNKLLGSNSNTSTTTTNDAYNFSAWLPSKLLSFQSQSDVFSASSDATEIVTFFHLDALCVVDVASSSANKLLIDAAANMISSGLSDQEEKSLNFANNKAAGNKLAEDKRGNGDAIVQCGGLLLLLTLLQLHRENTVLLVYIVNALNSVYLTSVERNMLLNEKLAEELVSAVQRLHAPQCSHSNTTTSISNNEFPLTLTLFALGSVCLSAKGNKLTNDNSDTFTQQQRNQLLDLGLVDILTSVLQHNVNDALLVEVACRNLHFLAADNSVGNVNNSNSMEGLKQKMGQQQQQMEELVRYLALCCQYHLTDAVAMHYLCGAIAALAVDNLPLQHLLETQKVPQMIAMCLKRKVDHLDVCRSCCQAIYALKDLNPLWYQCGIAEWVITGLNQHVQDIPAVECIFQAIASLAEYPPNKDVLDAFGVCKSISNALQRHVNSETIFTAFSRDTSSAGVAQYGCTAIYYLAKGVQGHAFQERLVIAGVCDSVARALVKYAEFESVAYCCCRALVVLLINNEPLKTKFGAAGVCSCIVESLHLFPSSVQVAKWGCRAVAVLAENHESNIAKLGVAGACETIPLLLQSHPSSEHIAGAGCDVIAFMSENIANRFAVRFGHAGACEAVVSVIRKHYENSNVLVRACVAMAALARVTGNSRWFGPTGACEGLQSALRHHEQDSRTARYIVTAAGNLCIVNHNRNRFGMLGFCVDLCRIMQLHILDADFAKACISTIWKLCENEEAAAEVDPSSKQLLGESRGGSELESVEVSEDDLMSPLRDVSEANPTTLTLFQASGGVSSNNRDIFAQSGVFVLLVEVMQQHQHLVDVMQAALRCVAILCTGKNRTKERDEFGNIGLCALIVHIMHTYATNAMVTLWGSFAVRALTESHPNNRLRFHQHNMPSLLISLWNTNKEEGINQNMDAIICAMANLATDCPENKVAFGDHGACEVLLEYLEQHYRSVDMCYLGLRALSAVVLDCEDNILKLSFANNAGETFVTIVSRYPEEEGIVVHALALISSLSTNKGKLERGNDALTFYACELVANLAQHAIWKDKFGQMGYCKTICVVLSRSLTALTTKCDTTNDLATTRKDSKAVMNTTEISYWISIVIESCRALVALVSENESNKQKFLSLGILETLTSSLDAVSKIDDTLSNSITLAQTSLLSML